MTATEITAPLQGVVAAVRCAAGDTVRAGAPVLILEVMKMEHPVEAPASGRIVSIAADVGQSVAAGEVLGVIEPGEVAHDAGDDDRPLDLEGGGRGDLGELRERLRFLADDAPARAERVAARHAAGHRTVRENLADLFDDGSFEEWGGFAIAAQRARRDLQELIERTPADGMVAGIGTIDGRSVGVAGYDYLVLAGTQGTRNHMKKDRLFEIVERLAIPLVLFAEGGGGRPGDTDYAVVAGLDTMAFALFARLSGRVPTVGIANGYCFAGNAALLGCCDVVIATEDASIGMGGPAMIEGGGLGVHRPEDVGPVSVQAQNGVIDIVVASDEEAVEATRRYLSYFGGTSAAVDTPARRDAPGGSGGGGWECADQRLLRHAVPERRTEIYDVRRVVEVVCDTGSVLELRVGFGIGIITALGRIEGCPLGIIANNPAHLGGAIDSDAADKAARFLQLCEAYGLPVVSFCDTPGFMVGPEAEESAQVRHFSRMFVTGASLTVPYVTVVLRKGYGLGAQAMAGGSFHAQLLTIAWPTGEFGGMGLEGAVKLAYRRELEALADENERTALYDKLVAAAYERGKALSMAMHFEIDDVIDPADTRRRIMNVLTAASAASAVGSEVEAGGRRPRRPFVDTW